MSEREKSDIGYLKLEIAPETLRRVIGEGRLSEFAATVAEEAYAHITNQIVQKVAEAALEQDGLQAGVSINVGYIFEEGDFGTVPPIPKWGVGPVIPRFGGGILNRIAAGRMQGEM